MWSSVSKRSRKYSVPNTYLVTESFFARSIYEAHMFFGTFCGKGCLMVRRSLVLSTGSSVQLHIFWGKKRFFCTRLSLQCQLWWKLLCRLRVSRHIQGVPGWGRHASPRQPVRAGEHQVLPWQTEGTFGKSGKFSIWAEWTTAVVVNDRHVCWSCLSLRPSFSPAFEGNQGERGGGEPFSLFDKWVSFIHNICICKQVTYRSGPQESPGDGIKLACSDAVRSRGAGDSVLLTAPRWGQSCVQQHILWAAVIYEVHCFSNFSAPDIPLACSLWMPLSGLCFWRLWLQRSGFLSLPLTLIYFSMHILIQFIGMILVNKII